MVTLPDTGIDLSEYVTLLVTGIGGVAALAIGGYFAFRIVRIGLRWLRKIA